MDSKTDSFSALERLLIERSEEAIRDGLQLEAWCRDQQRKIDEAPLNLRKAFTLPNQAYGYLGALPLNGKSVSVMGVRQVVEFDSIGGRYAEERLLDFVMGEFLPLAHWVYDDGYPGGFTIEQSLYRDAAGAYGRFEEDSRNGCVDWRRLGPEYRWVLLTAKIHDFVMKFGPYLKRFHEAACVVAHADFVHVNRNPMPGYKLEVAVGYPFVEYAPVPNHFGFGPGKFKTAVKLYSFLLTDTNKVEVRMDFAAAPRCAKVFDFGKWIPDPLYGGAQVLHRLTFGRWNAQHFHDRLDRGMVAQHARVHQALMDGVGRIWKTKVAGAGQK